MEKEGTVSYTLLMAKEMYGRLLLKLKREDLAIKHLKDSQALAE